MIEYLFLRRADYQSELEAEWFTDEGAARARYRNGRDFRSQGGSASLWVLEDEELTKLYALSEGIDPESLRALAHLEVLKRKGLVE